MHRIFSSTSATVYYMCVCVCVCVSGVDFDAVVL